MAPDTTDIAIPKSETLGQAKTSCALVQETMVKVLPPHCIVDIWTLQKHADAFVLTPGLTKAALVDATRPASQVQVTSPHHQPDLMVSKKVSHHPWNMKVSPKLSTFWI